MSPLQPAGGIIDGSFDAVDEWTPNPLVVSDRLRLLLLNLGSPASGPQLHLMNMPGMGYPSEPYPHHHRTDAFRVQVRDRDDEYFMIGPRRHGFGDYYLQPANTTYADPVGPDGMTCFLFFADRRGYPQIRRDNRSSGSEQLIEQMRTSGQGIAVEGQAAVHAENGQAVSGLRATHTRIPLNGLTDSVLDDASWTRLYDGSTVCGLFLGDPTSGPLIVLSHNAPGAAEAPAGSYGSDMVRVVLQGSCTVGDHTLGPLDFRATEAGTAEGTVVHGGEGSVQLVALADRRGWRPNRAPTARLAEVAAALGIRGALAG